MNKRIERKMEKLFRKLSNRYDFDECVLIDFYAHSIVGEFIREAQLGCKTFEIRYNSDSDSDIMFAKDVAKVVELYLEDFKEKGFCNYKVIKRRGC